MTNLGGFGLRIWIQFGYHLEKYILYQILIEC